MVAGAIVMARLLLSTAVVILLNLVASEIFGYGHHIAVRIVRMGVRLLPKADRPRFSEEWEADIRHLTSEGHQVTALLWSVGAVWGAARRGRLLPRFILSDYANPSISLAIVALGVGPLLGVALGLIFEPRVGWLVAVLFGPTFTLSQGEFLDFEFKHRHVLASAIAVGVFSASVYDLGVGLIVGELYSPVILMAWLLQIPNGILRHPLVSVSACFIVSSIVEGLARGLLLSMVLILVIAGVGFALLGPQYFLGRIRKRLTGERFG